MKAIVNRHYYKYANVPTGTLMNYCSIIGIITNCVRLWTAKRKPVFF